MKLSVHFIWYDFWIGWFWDRLKRLLYVCPLPCVALRFAFKTPCRDCRGTGKYQYNYAYVNPMGEFVQGSIPADPLPCPHCDGTGKAYQ